MLNTYQMYHEPGLEEFSFDQMSEMEKQKVQGSFVLVFAKF